MSDYYKLLGVPRTATQKEIRQAYRRLARQHHPDVNAGNKASEERFKEINEAHSVLSDPEKRRKYDRYGDNWMHAERIEEAESRSGSGGGFRWTSQTGHDPSSAFGADSGSIFDGLFHTFGRETRRPRATEYAAEVTLEEAYAGTTRMVELAGGRRLEVKIPPGVDNGSRIRVSPNGDSTGDLYLVVTVKPHPRFRREGRNLLVDVEASLEQAILGGDVNVSTLRGRLALTLPPETQNGQRFRLAGQGMPALNDQKSKGDLFAIVKVKLPTKLTPEEQDLFNRFKDLRAGKGR